jgi:DNA excision repair protein ERCC-2
VDIFLGTYHYAFDPMIRATLLKSLDADLSGVYVIVDEAHNLPIFSRELLSDQLTLRTVREALRETETFEHELVPSVQEYLETLDYDVFSRFQDSLEVGELRRVAPQGLSEIFQERCNFPGQEVAEIIHDYGEGVRETRRKLGYNRIYSYNHRVGEFLINFFEKEPERYLHLAHKDRRDRANMEVRCFDGRALTDPVLREAKGSILMSGFLSPIQVYRDLTLNDEKTTHLKEFNSPFPPENRLILVAKGVSSRFKERTYTTIQRWKEYIEAILEANQGNVAVFSTSYNLMHTILKHIETNRNVIVEKPKTRRQVLLKQLSRTSENALFGVMGGKFSEGVDYPGKLLTCVVAVGLPYAKWNVYQSAMISYYDKQYPERGRLYAYITPAILRLVQACGRVHRSEKDKGCIAILDERVIDPKIRQLLPNYFQEEMKIISDPNEALNQIEAFWKGHPNFN